MKNIISKIARKHGITPEECRTAMQQAINLAWATGDPKTKQHQIEMAGEGSPPTPEELIETIATRIS